MANIIDYLNWRGDITFDERPINDVDNIILATFSYLDLTGIVPPPKSGSVSFAHACQAVLEDTGGDVDLRVRSLAKLDPSLLTRLADSRRFGHARLHSYMDVLDETRALQFAAVQIDLTDTETYVSFRGTDSTLVGWREDFMLSFSMTESQRLAALYLEDAAKLALKRGRKLYVGGHSKGGNLAVYGALSCPIDLLPVINRVWSNDGPGISPELMPVSPQMLLGERYSRIVPEDDVIGMIFEREDDPRTIIKTSSSSMRAHDPFTWQVTPFGADEAGDLTTSSKAIRNAISTWTSEVPLEDRGTLVDELFDALESGGAKTTEDLVSSVQSVSTVLSALNNMDTRTKELGMSLVETVVTSSLDMTTLSVRESLSQAFKVARESARDRGWMTAGNTAIDSATAILRTARDAFLARLDGTSRLEEPADVQEEPSDAVDRELPAAEDEQG